jgi:divalent metal cation (Fe/Co/Zn/Cd) transporter
MEAPGLMPASPPSEQDQSRRRLVMTAQWLVLVSVIFGIGSGAVSVITGLRASSLGVFAAGVGVLADMSGSAVLVWRFRAEQRHPGLGEAAEDRAALVVALALALASMVITIEAIVALASGSRPGTSAATVIAAAISLAVLTPLACAKRRLGWRMASRALHGDGTLSGIGAATSLLALTALAIYHTLGWWWPDRAAALIVAAIAAAEARHTMPHRPARPAL